MSLKYRADIDGLRAVAVLMVVLFHLDMPYITGGYVGVDVFFVISGFLITSIIVRDIDAGTFSLLDFYERRVKRILPAIFTVMAVCLIASYFILFPPEFQYFGTSMASTAAFGSNILFWDQSGYFEVESKLVPLLHTWSLAVEEQFYILFPFLLMIATRYFKRWRVHIVIACLLLSFAISVGGLMFEKYAAVFYLLPARAWELMAGSVLALGIFPQIKRKVFATTTSSIGLGMVLYAGFIYTEDTLFPGASAILPVLGSVILIHSATNITTPVARILGHKIPVFIGKISYSLYLWHWPLIVFYSYASPYKMTIWASMALFTAAFVLSVLSWKFVEQPARYKMNISRAKLFILASLISIAFIVAGYGIHKHKGLPDRFPENVQKLIKVDMGIKIPNLKHMGFEGNSGILGVEGGAPSFIVWGDSHAKAATPALDKLAKDMGQTGYILEDSGCMPAAEELSIFEESCNRANQKALDFILAHPEIKRVVLIARWYAYGKRITKHVKKGRVEISNDTVNPPAHYIGNVLKILTTQGKDVFFVTEPPEATVEAVPLYLARAKHYGQEVSLDVPLSRHRKMQAHIDMALDSLSDVYPMTIIRAETALCRATVCRITHDGRSLYYDDDHISAYGALYIQDIYKPVFE